MPEYLSEREWKKVLKRPENKHVKKTGISDLLRSYAKVEASTDAAARSTALNAILGKAREVKRTKGFNSDLVEYLDSMSKAAEQALVKLEGAGDTRGGDPGLQALLTVAKTRDAKSALHFVLAPGRPKSGLVISRKPPSHEARVVARNQRGKAGPMFEGTVYGEAGKYVFELAEAPPSGLAKAIKRAVQDDTERTIRVLVRGGGRDVDDEADVDVDFSPPADPPPKAPPQEPAAAPRAEPRPEAGAATRRRVASFVEFAGKAAALPREKHAEALQRVVELARQIAQEVRADPAIEQGERDRLTTTVLETAAKAKQALTHEAEQPAAEPTPEDPAKAPFELGLAKLKPLLNQARGVQPAQPDTRSAQQELEQAMRSTLGKAKDGRYREALGELEALARLAERVRTLATRDTSARHPAPELTAAGRQLFVTDNHVGRSKGNEKGETTRTSWGVCAAMTIGWMAKIVPAAQGGGDLTAQEPEQDPLKLGVRQGWLVRKEDGEPEGMSMRSFERFELPCTGETRAAIDSWDKVIASELPRLTGPITFTIKHPERGAHMMALVAGPDTWLYFDPNRGVFEYQDRSALATALRGWTKRAYGRWADGRGEYAFYGHTADIAPRTAAPWDLPDHGTIDRPAAEAKLAGGGWLLRWSDNAGDWVVSAKTAKGFEHVAIGGWTRDQLLGRYSVAARV